MFDALASNLAASSSSLLILSSSLDSNLAWYLASSSFVQSAIDSSTYSL